MKPTPAILIDQLVRSRRKSIALVVTREGKLLVRAPQRVPLSVIEEFVRQKADWIREKQASARAAASALPRHVFAPGETFPYLGRSYPLALAERARPLLALQPAGDSLAFVLARSAQGQAREVFVTWYRAQAQAVLRERVAYWSALSGLAPSGLRITSARTRWGSCSGRGVLSFPWRLVMAPQAAIDYVVVHELAHLKERNHARPFWLVVARILPEYKTQVAWFKTNGHLLTF